MRWEYSFLLLLGVVLTLIVLLNGSVEQEVIFIEIEENAVEV